MKKHLFVILFLLGAMSARAQNAHLRITSLINFPDTAFEGVAYPVQFVLKNVGAAPYQGPFQVLLQGDSLLQVFFFSQSPGFVLLPNDTVILSAGNGALGYTFSSTVYRAGSDVVVVWPYTTQQSVTVDTLYTAVYFIPLGTIADGLEVIKPKLKVFPNPFNSNIYLEMADGSSLEWVRINDLFGREIYRRENSTEVISLPDISSGLYILELVTSEKRTVVIKLLKQ